MSKGYAKNDVEDSLKTMKYDDITATYLLLGRRANDVSWKHKTTCRHKNDWNRTVKFLINLRIAVITLSGKQLKYLSR